MLTVTYGLANCCCLLAAHAAAAQSTARASQQAVDAKKSSRDPYVDTPEYSTFPWKFEAEHAFFFLVNPLRAAPTPPAAYAGYTEQLTMQGGMQTGLLTVIKYKNSFIGPYSELLFR